MTEEEAVRLNPAYKQLRREASEGGTHAYLIVTPDTVTSELCAKAFIGFSTGKQNVAELKDVYDLPFGDKVLITDSEFLTEQAYVMPTNLDKKYFVVHRAETANEAAQNKLLKTLEEPPETAVVILLCANEYAMLPTVRSRCRMIYPSAYGDDVLRSVLATECPDCANPSFTVAVASGSLSRLRQAALDGTETFDSALRMLMCMRKSSQILSYATELIVMKDKIGDYLDAVELILRDCMVFAWKPSLIKLKDNVKDIAELSSVYRPEACLKETNVLTRARKRLSGGGNINSIVDEFLFSLLEEKAKCQK